MMLCSVPAERFVADMDELGVDASGAASHMKEGKKRARSISKREPSVAADDDMADDGEAAPTRGRSLPRPGFRSPRGASTSRAPSDEPRSRSRSRARNASRGEPLPGEGFKDAKQKVSVIINGVMDGFVVYFAFAVELLKYRILSPAHGNMATMRFVSIFTV